MDSGGGGGGESYTTMTDPAAAALAGQYQVQAARMAAQAAKDNIATAIGEMRNQFTQSRTDLSPYRSTGVEALDQLNRYLGLAPYNPGNKAPEAPTKPTLDSLKAKITNQQVLDYAKENTRWSGLGPQWGKWASDLWTYSGVGAKSGNKEGGTNYANPDYNHVARDHDTEIRNYFAEQQLPSELTNYESLQKQYDTNLHEYNINKGLFDKYSALGPMTPEQVQAEIAAQPGFQFRLGQGINAISKASSAGGYLGSGRLLKELQRYGEGLASQEYGNTLSRLANLAGMGANAAAQTAQGSQNLGAGVGSLYNNLGDTIANSNLASGQALANSAILQGQRIQSLGGGGGGGGMGGFGSLLGGVGTLLGGKASGATGLGMFF